MSVRLCQLLRLFSSGSLEENIIDVALVREQIRSMMKSGEETIFAGEMRRSRVIKLVVRVDVRIQAVVMLTDVMEIAADRRNLFVERRNGWRFGSRGRRRILRRTQPLPKFVVEKKSKRR